LSDAQEHTVLVVDDEPSIRLLCRVNLELEGYRVLEAGSIPAARETLGSASVDVMLLDVHVGSDDGRDFLAEVRSDFPDLPVAMLTGTAELSRGEREAADAVIPKPFPLEQLSATVERLAVHARARG
jgi:DNA-binding NtrC family response regulator